MKQIIYASQEFWDLFKPMYQWSLVDKKGNAILSNMEHMVESNGWVCKDGYSFDLKYQTLDHLNIIDLPTDWTQSLRKRPEVIKVGDAVWTNLSFNDNIPIIVIGIVRHVTPDKEHLTLFGRHETMYETKIFKKGFPFEYFDMEGNPK